MSFQRLRVLSLIRKKCTIRYALIGMHKTSEVGLKFMFYFILFSYSFKFMF